MIQWVTQDSKTKKFTWNDEKSHSTKTELNVLMDKATEYKVVSETSVTISPLIGEGKVRLNFLIKLDTDLKQYLKGTGALASATIFTHVNITWTTDLIFRSVSSGGLQVAAQNTAPIISVTNEVKEGGALSDVLKALRDLCKIDNVKDEVNKLVKEFIQKTIVWDGISKSIEKALNGQNKFIFPGGGTFEMKDPIFNNNCDLLIGLSYKKGESA
jgi:urease gamma subunit